MQDFGIEILSEFNKLKPSPHWSFNNINRAKTSYISHGYHRYPAKFIPQIVQMLMKELTKKNDIVVDPFGGCGTTLVESKVYGRKSIGFDINPVAKLITDIKVTPFQPNILEKTYRQFVFNYSEMNDTVPEINNDRLRYWFDEKTIKELDRIYKTIKLIKSYKTRKFYFIAFSHVLKNCSRWLMKSIKPQVDKEKTQADPFKIFNQHLLFMMKRNQEFYELLSKNNNLDILSTMRIADSTRKLPIDDNSIDLIITSPPYVTSYEYADLHQLSLLWFGNDKNYFKRWTKHVDDFSGFRKKFMGTSAIKDYKIKIDVNSNIAADLIGRLNDKDKSIAKSVSNYFSDMNKAFKEMYRILKPGAKVCIIIGNTTLQGVEIKNAEVATEQLFHIGFKKNKIIKREIGSKIITSWRDANNGRFTSLDNKNKKRVHQYEYIIIMEKKKEIFKTSGTLH